MFPALVNPVPVFPVRTANREWKGRVIVRKPHPVA